jgi:hypothetical protein
MHTIDLIRHTIQELEAAPAVGGDELNRTLERLYSAYAQAQLGAKGIHVDLMAACAAPEVPATPGAAGPLAVPDLPRSRTPKPAAAGLTRAEPVRCWNCPNANGHGRTAASAPGTGKRPCCHERK